MKDYEFGYDEQCFNALCLIAKKMAGIEIDHSKMDMMYSRLIRIIRVKNIPNFIRYIELIQDPLNTDLINDFTNAITTNLTSFFREKHHFEQLSKVILPELLVKNKHNKTIRIWSAGCSTGEEPYSIAFTVKEFLESHPGWTVHIYASDIDSAVLKKAQEGIYKIEDIHTLEPHMLQQWFIKGMGKNDGLCKVKPEFTQSIEFFKFNLMEQYEKESFFDAIFCRNVLIYFDSINQNKILDNMMNNLVPNGFLFAGHSESFVYHYKKTKLIGNTIYRKIT